MIDAVFSIVRDTERRDVALASYLDAAGEERALTSAYGWIKSLRHAHVDGVPLRRRFTTRGDSLWWFAELYLHKQEVILALFKALGALETLIEREQPRSVQLIRGSRLVRGLAPVFMASRSISYKGSSGFVGSSALRLAAIEGRATALNAAALASRWRMSAVASPAVGATVLTFVHRAFWRAEAGDGSAEAYIGPVLAALERRLGAGNVSYVTVGPASNFRARRWWHPLRGARSRNGRRPIEAYAPLTRTRRLASDLARTPSRRAGRSGRARTCARCAVIRGCDCWPRCPRGARRASRCCSGRGRRARWTKPAPRSTPCEPRVAVTYAEAGGWGRALVLECRRRGDSVGRPAARLHLPALVELSSRAGRDGCRPRARDDRGFPRPTRRCSSTTTPPITCRARAIFRPNAGRDRQPPARRARGRARAD